MDNITLNEYEISILRVINQYHIPSISIRSPRKQLDTLLKGKKSKETLEALRHLRDLEVVNYDPSLDFGLFDKGGYKVNEETAKEIWKKYEKSN